MFSTIEQLPAKRLTAKAFPQILHTICRKLIATNRFEPYLSLSAHDLFLLLPTPAVKIILLLTRRARTEMTNLLAAMFTAA